MHTAVREEARTTAQKLHEIRTNSTLVIARPAASRDSYSRQLQLCIASVWAKHLLARRAMLPERATVSYYRQRYRQCSGPKHALVVLLRRIGNEPRLTANAVACR